MDFENENNNSNNTSIVRVNTKPYLEPAWEINQLAPFQLYPSPFMFNQHGMNQSAAIAAWQIKQFRLQSHLKNARTLPETFIRSNSIALIVFGILMILMQIVQIIFSLYYTVYFAHYYTIASGIWTGVYYIVTASISISIAEHDNKCLIITSLVMQAIGILIGIPALVLNSLGVQLVCSTFIADTSSPTSSTCLIATLINMHIPLIVISIICIITSFSFLIKISCTSNLLKNQTGLIDY